MKKIEKMIHQIIRFRGNIEAFLVSIEEFSRSTKYVIYLCELPLAWQMEEKLTTVDIFHHKAESVLSREWVF